MGSKSDIEWTDSTWNPIRGCSRVSEGCRNCYAETMAARFSGPGLAYEGLAVLQHGKPHWTGKIEFVDKHLIDPIRWRTPRKIFVNSMSDLFHENATDGMRDKIVAVMALSPQHTFQILTKRPERSQAYWNDLYTSQAHRLRIAEIAERITPGTRATPEWLRNHAYQPASSGAPALKNIHMGVSGEETETATKRAWVLLKTIVAVRFLSAEPLLGPLDLNKGELICKTWRKGATIGTYLDWVICGGESGNGARPMPIEWARSLRDQCAADDVPFFMKQMGSCFGAYKGKAIPAELNIKQFPRSN